jgi:hypothetical protein
VGLKRLKLIFVSLNPTYKTEQFRYFKLLPGTEEFAEKDFHNRYPFTQTW